MNEQPNALKGIKLRVHPIKKIEQVPNKPGVPVLAADSDGKLLKEKELRALDEHIKQNTEQPTCKTCKGFGDKYCVQKGIMIPCPDCKPEQPNTELLIVKTIQGLTTCISNELEKLVVLRGCMPINNMMVLIDQAIEDINSFEKNPLFELQKAFE